MTPETALNILTQATANVQLTRDDHQKVIEALNVMKGLIPAEDKKKAK